MGILTLFLLSVSIFSLPTALAEVLSNAERALRALENTLTAQEIIADPTKAPGAASIIGRIINMAMGLLGLVFFILVVYGGIIWLTAGGNEQKAERAVKILTQSSLGLIIVIAAYIFTNVVVFRIISISTAP